METYVTSAESPCKGCLLVEDPESCMDKNCQLWQQWFVESWNDLRQKMQCRCGQGSREVRQ